MGFIDLTGQGFGQLVVLRRAENDRHGSARWACRCDCGKVTVVLSSSLRRGATRSCGCLARPPDLTGQRFGRLTVIRRAKNDKYWQTRWFARCDCGKVTVVLSSNLRRGHSLSCGCLRQERTAASHTKHGHARSHGSPEYRAWTGAKARTTNPNLPCWQNYGGRGIRMAEEWMHDFAAFFTHVGPRPQGRTPSGWPLYSLDRIDTDGMYEPGNVRWATRSEQARNRRRYRRHAQQGAA
jgi:hypothetical protein